MIHQCSRLLLAAAESLWFVFDPGCLTFNLCDPSAASPLVLIGLPHLMISEAECNTEWIFSQHKKKGDRQIRNTFEMEETAKLLKWKESGTQGYKLFPKSFQPK